MSKASHCSKSILYTLILLLNSCNSGSNTNTAAATVQLSQLATYKKLLTFYPTKNPNLKATSNNQQSFSINTSVKLNKIRVSFFSSNDCSNSTTALIEMNGGANGVIFAPGTYSSSGASNYALCGRYAGGCNGLFSQYNAGTLKSMRFDYYYAATENTESGVVSGTCMSGNADSNNTEAILNWAGGSAAAATACTNSNTCGFSQPYSVSLPDTFRPQIFVSAIGYDGNLGGLAGADNKCQIDANIPSNGSGSTWKALLEGNNATTNGVDYYRANDYTFIAQATGGNLVDDNALSNGISTFDFDIWTGYNSIATCSNFTSSNAGELGIVGYSSAVNNAWWVYKSQACNLTAYLYCVQQNN